MSDEIKMCEIESNVRASAVMQFAEMIRSAYESGFMDNHPTIYDIYRAAQNYVNDNYGVKTDNWDDEFASASRVNTHDQHVERIAELESMLSHLYQHDCISDCSLEKEIATLLERLS